MKLEEAKKFDLDLKLVPPPQQQQEQLSPFLDLRSAGKMFPFMTDVFFFFPGGLVNLPFGD